MTPSEIFRLMADTKTGVDELVIGLREQNVRRPPKPGKRGGGSRKRTVHFIS